MQESWCSKKIFTKYIIRIKEQISMDSAEDVLNRMGSHLSWLLNQVTRLVRFYLIHFAIHHIHLISIFDHKHILHKLAVSKIQHWRKWTKSDRQTSDFYHINNDNLPWIGIHFSHITFDCHALFLFSHFYICTSNWWNFNHCLT